LNTIVKVAVGASVIGLVFLAYRYVKNAMANFDVEIAGYGTPKISNLSVTIPLVVKFKNPTPIPINADKVLAEIYIKKNNAFVKAATVNQALTIQPGTSTQNIFPVIDLKSIFGGNVFDTFTSVTSMISSKKIIVKADVTVLYKGIALPTQTLIEELPLT
jgi:hypothetical protein